MRLLFLGDFLYDYEALQPDIEALGAHLASHDYVTVLNLEGALKGTHPERVPLVLFHKQGLIEALKALRVVAVNLANNHALDWGREGLQRVTAALSANGIVAFGAGFDRRQAQQLKTISIDGQRIGLLGFGWTLEDCTAAGRRSPGVAPLERTAMLRAIRLARPQVDRLIVQLHMGVEFELYPLPRQRRLAQQCVEAGADLVVGHHPHVLQSFEIYRERHIYYSLGNFYFGSRRADFSTLNPVASLHSQYGLGIGCAPGTPDLAIDKLFFHFNGEKTELSPERPLHDLSGMPIDAYNQFFREHRKVRWRPALYVGRRYAVTNLVEESGYLAKRLIRSRLHGSALLEMARRVRHPLNRAR
jgi:hypothetical protein